MKDIISITPEVMQRFEEHFQFVSIGNWLIAALIIFITSSILWYVINRIKIIKDPEGAANWSWLVFVIASIFFSGAETTIEDVGYLKVKRFEHLYSIKPPEITTTGTFGSSFFFGYGNINGEIAYIFRAKRDVGYRDILVTGGANIVPDNSLKDSGILKEVSYVFKGRFKFKILGYEFKNYEITKETRTERFIFVPEDAINKHMKI